MPGVIIVTHMAKAKVRFPAMVPVAASPTHESGTVAVIADIIISKAGKRLANSMATGASECGARCASWPTSSS